MAATVQITRDTATPAIRAARAAFTPAARAALHRAAEQPLLALVKRHLAALAQSRHASAQSLGATPTGILGEAARRSYSSSDETAARVAVPSAAVTRTFRDVTITPRPPRRALAIPLHRWAYGVSPRDWDRRHSDRPLVFIPRPGKSPLLATSYAKKLTPMYILVSRVRQRQDRALLPSDVEIRRAAWTGMSAALRAAMARRGQ